MELPSEIVEQFLYLGAERHARNLDVLQSLGITHILNVSTEVPNYFATHEEGRPSITYLKCSLMDNDSENIHERFEEAFEFIGMLLACLPCVQCFDSIRSVYIE
eukprot:GEZU01023491.1.p1 GENE.GEZU01023491.1~~GEZU01023491.1.p1  ORF type:complete len:104 (-),score=9.25 GEZU01023491.1:4-315(-)